MKIILPASMFIAALLLDVLAVGQPVQTPTPAATPAIEDDPELKKLAPAKQTLLRNATSVKKSVQPQNKPSQIVETEHQEKSVVVESTAVKDCIKGAGTALLISGIATAVGCLVDAFLTGGALCVTYLATATTSVPLTVGSGCALGIMNATGAQIGMSTIPRK